MWSGAAWHGPPRTGDGRAGLLLQTAAQGISVPSAALYGEQTWRGQIGSGVVRKGGAWQQLQTAARRAQAFPAALFGEWLWCNEALMGLALRGQEGREKAWRGFSCRQQHGGLRLSLLLSLESGCGMARRDAADFGKAWCGDARLQLQTAAQELSGSSAALARE